MNREAAEPQSVKILQAAPFLFANPEVFWCPSITATENIEISKGTITNHGNSGTVGEGDDEVGEVETVMEPSGILTVCILVHPLDSPM